MATRRLLPFEFERLLASMPERVEARVRQVAAQTGLRMEREGKLNATRRFRKRSGDLRRSISAPVVPSTDGLNVVLSAGKPVAGVSDLVYARIQEYGGIVTPKRVKWLAIPDEAIQTKAGNNRPPSARQYPGRLRFVLDSPVHARLVETVGGESVTRYRLRKKVEIKPKYYLRDAFNKVLQGVPRHLQDAIGAGLSAEPGGGFRGADLRANP